MFCNFSADCLRGRKHVLRPVPSFSPGGFFFSLGFTSSLPCFLHFSLARLCLFFPAGEGLHRLPGRVVYRIALQTAWGSAEAVESWTHRVLGLRGLSAPETRRGNMRGYSPPQRAVAREGPSPFIQRKPGLRRCRVASARLLSAAARASREKASTQGREPRGRASRRLPATVRPPAQEARVRARAGTVPWRGRSGPLQSRPGSPRTGGPGGWHPCPQGQTRWEAPRRTDARIAGTQPPLTCRRPQTGGPREAPQSLAPHCGLETAAPGLSAAE